LPARPLRDVASGAGAIFDNELLPESLGDHLAGEPGHDVVYPAWGVADQQKHRP